ncbi:cytochrome o ubiquinol oxidase subunit IV [Sphingomonas sp. RS2018]
MSAPVHQAPTDHHEPTDHHGPVDHQGHEATEDHGSRRSYLIGFGLSVLLTAIPFWLVMSGVLGDPRATGIAVVALAVAQIVVHTIFFLHVSARSEGGWTLLALLFTLVIVAIVICGSLWIMFHLNTNMMPMPGGGMADAP